MKIKIFLTRGEPIIVTEEQAQAILASTEPLIAIKDASGKWNGDVVHRSHIVQMTRDLEAEREERLKNPRLQEEYRPVGKVGNVKDYRPSFFNNNDL